MSDNDTFKFKTLGDCFLNQAEKQWIIKNVIAKGETSSWFGPPGAGKSALLAEIAFHVVAKPDWRGFQVCPVQGYERQAVLYFALERADLTERRMLAHAYREGLPANLPFAISSEPLNLLDPRCVDLVVNTVSKFENAIGDSTCVTLIIIDTYSKAIVGGDEDKAQTQNLAGMHIQRIHDCLYGTAHIATVGHSGKNPSAGERGSNARTGHVDLAVQISGDKVRTATVVKANDQPHGPLTTFAIEEYQMANYWGDDYALKPYTVAILAAATPAPEARTAAPQRITGKHAQALDALGRAIVGRGDAGAVHTDYWKEELAKVGLIRADDKNPRATFARIRTGISQHIIAEPNGLVRINLQPGQIPPPA
ncbi:MULTISPECIES: AAA family ATPase [unclassified Bradyrhizobium]|uniref:AAA family ATPase n=1 Tax=unclassified Bradyrhizobium TaxID=2631580 RepID=UPI001FFAE7D8|nr:MULTISPECIES: AAA family ATPase [unclassified Bradyrhizobium]MCK1270104.1 AAA family ATPase [Bradyrhizobium sp. 84]MCK1373480.1 AAA family ATPase [Bradyrhizobium sp. 49]MCK1428987.1 AAA family ATPase [Bradyrhizobium sp. 87]